MYFKPYGDVASFTPLPFAIIELVILAFVLAQFIYRLAKSFASIRYEDQRGFEPLMVPPIDSEIME